MEQSNTPNPGKGLGLTGFILALVALIGGGIVWFVAVADAGFNGGGMGLAIGWAVYCVIATVLSFMGMNKSKAAGQKNGLALGGLIIGIIAVVTAVTTIWSVHTAQGMHNDAADALDAIGNMLDTMQH
ncbi:MAG TPA: hypothetical protein VL651_09605 [Bacteroidia bacterium]|jgi:hypothetical protein|nr:hypothetical protein [Bacteroidia bacterium]